MAFDIPLPQITGTDPATQLRQIKNYLYQLVENLQYTVNTVGNDGTGYVSPAPAQSGLRAVQQSTGPTFAEIKSMIIKSAEIVESYYEQMQQRFRGSFLAVSDFGIYREETAAAIMQTSEQLRQCYTNVRQIETDVTQLEQNVIETSACIRTGLLYETPEGVPVYGLEIGQQNTVDGVEVFRKFARMTADRLAFFDANDREVAWISDNQLNVVQIDAQSITVPRAVVQRIQIGDYLLGLDSTGHLSLQ